MKKYALLGVVLLMIAITLVGCGASQVSKVNVEETGSAYVISFQYVKGTRVAQLPQTATISVEMVDGDGVRYRKHFYVNDLTYNEDTGFYTLSILYTDVPSGFYETGTVKVVVDIPDSKFVVEKHVFLPVVKPTALNIDKLYTTDKEYVITLSARRDGKDAAFGKETKVYIGDMSGRTLYLHNFDTEGKKGSLTFKIPVGEVKDSYTRHVLVKAKLVSFNLSTQRNIKAHKWLKPSSVKVSFQKDGTYYNVLVCPKVDDRYVPVEGNIYVSVKAGIYDVISKTFSVSYKDFKGGCYPIYLPKTPYSPDGKLYASVKVSFDGNTLSGGGSVSGLPVAYVPDKFSISTSSSGSYLDVKVCPTYKGKVVPIHGKLILSLYDGKKMLWKKEEDVSTAGQTSGLCFTYQVAKDKVGPTSGGKAKMYLSFKPALGKYIKASYKISGFYKKVYLVGYYYASSLYARMRVVATDAKFIRDKYDKDKYYFGVYVTITNIGSESAYVFRSSFDAIDSMGNIYDGSYVGVKYEFDSGYIYPGHSRRGWIFFEVPDGVDISKVKYVKMGFNNALDKWKTLFTVPVYQYMFPSVSEDYKGT